MAARRRFGKKRLGSPDIALQITSMADIFTILLVFLLKNSATDASSVTMNSDITLADAKTTSPITETLKLEIADHTLLLGDQVVGSLQHYSFMPRDLDREGQLHRLVEGLRKERKKNSRDPNPKLLVFADEHVPFSTLKTVLSSAGAGGYTNFRLTVIAD